MSLRSPWLSQRQCAGQQKRNAKLQDRVVCGSSPRQTAKAEYIYKAMAVRNLAAFSFTSHILHTALRANTLSPEGDFLFQKTPPTHKPRASATSTHPRTATSPWEDLRAASAASAAPPSSSSSSSSCSTIEAQVKVHLLHDLLQQECHTREELVVQEAMVMSSLQSRDGPCSEALDTPAAAAAALKSSRAAQEGALADCGAEMDPISAELDLEIKGLRQELLKAVEEHAQVSARLEETGSVSELAANEELQHFAPAAASLGVQWAQESKQLQAKWQQLAYENMYLQVRIAQLRQLPGLPKRKITMAAVREQQAQDLFFRRSLLTQRTSEMAHNLLSRTRRVQ